MAVLADTTIQDCTITGEVDFYDATVHLDSDQAQHVVLKTIGNELQIRNEDDTAFGDLRADVFYGDGSQLTGVAGSLSSTDELPEGSTNLYYTDSRVSSNPDVTANTSARHTQNTDTGTTNQTFAVESGAGSHILLKNESGTLRLRNEADNNDSSLILNDLTVNGTTTTVNSEAVSVADNTITLNSDVSGSPSQDGGIEIERGSSTNASLIWDESATAWKAGLTSSETEIALHGEDISVFTNDSGFISDVSGFSTDDLSEGSTNLYSQWETSGSDITYSGGNVGIGITSPSELLHIKDSSNRARLIIEGENGINGTTGLILTDTGTQTWQIGVKGTDENGNLIFFNDTLGSRAITVEGDNNNVGIGTETPSSKLDVNGTIEGDGVLKLGGYDVLDAPNVGNLYIKGDNSGSLFQFQPTDGNTSMVLTSTGELGIGTTSPNQKLDVVGDVLTQTLRIDNGSGLDSDIRWQEGGTLRFLTRADNSIGSGTEGTLRFFAYDDTGSNIGNPMNLRGANVGIGGVLNPSTALEVNGTITGNTKNFLIDHPTKDGMKLRHGSLEGPENGVYHRGNLSGSNEIVLPDYWSGLVDESTITVKLTPKDDWQELYYSINGSGNIQVFNNGGNEQQINCDYVVYAERKDVDKLIVEESD